MNIGIVQERWINCCLGNINNWHPTINVQAWRFICAILADSWRDFFPSYAVAYEFEVRLFSFSSLEISVVHYWPFSLTESTFSITNESKVQLPSLFNSRQRDINSCLHWMYISKWRIALTSIPEQGHVDCIAIFLFDLSHWLHAILIARVTLLYAS